MNLVGYKAAVLAAVLLLAACPPEPPEEPQPPAAPETMHLWIFFTRGEEPHPVMREVPLRPDVLTAALEELLRGPTPEESAAGITSWFSSETEGMLRRVALHEQGLAVIDFEDFRPIIPGASTAAGSRALLGELNSTVARFETVRRLEYQLEGSCELFWNFLQRTCEILPFRR